MRVSKQYLLLICLTFTTASMHPLLGLCRTPKIVALIPVKNEEIFIEQCLKAIALIVDAIVVLDDASEDNTLKIIESLAHECHVERIIKKTSWKCREGDNRNELLEAGRDIFGTHFIVIDADEMFTWQCVQDNFLRKKILALRPGESLALHHIRLWKGTDQWRADNAATKHFAFYDDGTCSYDTSYLHTSRVPMNLSRTEHTTIASYLEHGVLHFQAINWDNVKMRKAWYLCTEAINRPEAGTKSLNTYYKWLTDETGADIRPCPASWYEGYAFFNPAIAYQEETWKKEYVRACFARYGVAYFAALDMGDLNLN